MTDTRQRAALRIAELHPETPDVRALVEAEISRSRYRSAPRAALESVIAGTDPDSHGLIALREERVSGLVIFGTIAGSVGAGRLQLIITEPGARRVGIATALVHEAFLRLRHGGARFTIVEIPDDPELAPGLALLRRCGFEEESRVADFFRDGVALMLLRRELAEDR